MLILYSVADCISLLQAKGLPTCAPATVRADSKAGYLTATAMTKGRRELLFLPEDAEAWADHFAEIRAAQESRVPARIRGIA